MRCVVIVEGDVRRCWWEEKEPWEINSFANYILGPIQLPCGSTNLHRYDFKPFVGCGLPSPLRHGIARLVISRGILFIFHAALPFSKLL